MLLKAARAMPLAASFVNLPTREGAGGNKIFQSLLFPLALMRYFGVVLRNAAPVYLTIAQSVQGFFRDAFVIRIAALFGRPVVCHLHGGNYDGFFAEQPRILQWLIRRTLLKTHTVIILSERLRSMFRFEPAIASRLSVVPNGLPLGLSGSSATKCLPSNPGNPIQILYLSNLIESKGYFDLLRALALLVNRHNLNVEGHFCGSFVGGDESTAASGEDAQRRFSEFIQEHGLGARVQFHGPVYGAEKAAFLTSAHILVLPTNYRNEGQPISIIEALAYGTVVVSTAFRAIPDLVIEGVTGRLVPFGDPARLAEVLAEIAGDPTAYRRMSSAAYELYQSSYTGRTHVTALLDLLCTVNSADAATGSSNRTIDLQLNDDAVLEQRATRVSQYFGQIATGWTAKYTSREQFRERIGRLLGPLSAASAAPARVLDFGSGTGNLARTLCDAGYDVSALDSSTEMIRCCRELLAGTSAQFLEARPAEWSRIETPDCWFDAIVASSVLEYVGQVEPQFNEFSRVLRDGGVLLFTVPNDASVSRRWEGALRPVLTSKVIEPFHALLPARLQSYRRYLEFSINHWPLEKWADALGQSGFENIQIQGGGHALALITARRAGRRGNPVHVTSSLERSE